MDIEDAFLRAAFSQFGEVQNIEIPRYLEYKNDMPHAFIVFSSYKEMEKASVLAINRVGDKTMYIKPKYLLEKKPKIKVTFSDSRCLNKSSLQKIFAKYGKVQTVTIPKQLVEPTTRYGYVEFVELYSAEQAIQAKQIIHSQEGALPSDFTNSKPKVSLKGLKAWQ